MSISSDKVHEDAWRKGVEASKSDNYNKYSIYASRILAIKHPEIHLKADSRFIDHITSNRGYSNSYAVKDVHSPEFLTDMQFRKYPPFSFDAVDFDEFKLTPFTDLYPENYPIFPFLDRRMLPVATTLKTRENKITSLEKIALLYQKNRIQRKDYDELYIIHCDNGESYLAYGENIIDATGTSNASIKGAPILIFNQEYIWYPMMHRYDTQRDNKLAQLVGEYATSKKLPTRTKIEEEIIDVIQETTCLVNDAQRAMAEICSLRSTGRQTCLTPLSEWFPLHGLWDTALPASRPRAWQYYGYLEQTLIRANKLSPIAAYLAALSMVAKGYDKLVVISKEWIDRVALPNYGYVWGHLWDECLVEYSIDGSFRTSAGHCMVQAMIDSAVLEMVGIDNYMMECEVPGSHHYVWIPEYEATFDNGRLKMSMNNVILDWPRGNKVLARFHHNGKFCSPIAGGEYSGSLSPEECVKEIDELASTYGNEIKVYENGEHETRPTVKNRNDRAIAEDYHILQEENWEELKLP